MLVDTWATSIKHLLCILI